MSIGAQLLSRSHVNLNIFVHAKYYHGLLISAMFKWRFNKLCALLHCLLMSQMMALFQTEKKSRSD